MTEEQIETKAVWKTIKGAQSLFELYGYYPTLHDASVTNFDVRFAQKQIQMTFEYCDLVGDEPEFSASGKSLATKIVIRWDKVSAANLEHYNNDIYHIGFQRLEDKIRTFFEISFGIGDYIISESVEITTVEASEQDSVTDLKTFLHTVNMTFSD